MAIVRFSEYHALFGLVNPVPSHASLAPLPSGKNSLSLFSRKKGDTVAFVLQQSREKHFYLYYGSI